MSTGVSAAAARRLFVSLAMALLFLAAAAAAGEKGRAFLELVLDRRPLETLG